MTQKDALSTPEDYKVYLDNLLRQVPGSIYWKDAQGVYLGNNLAHARSAGYATIEQVIGKTDYDLAWKENAAQLREVDERVMQTRAHEELIERGAPLDGSGDVVHLTHKAPLLDADGRVIGVIGTSLDITARARSEEKERAAVARAAMAEAQRQSEEESKKAVLVFAGSLAHDLRTPLLSLEILNEALKKNIAILQQDCDAQHARTSLDALQTLTDIGDAGDALLAQTHQFITDNLKLLRDSATSAVPSADGALCDSGRGLNQLVMLYPFEPGQRDMVVCNSAHSFAFRGNFLLFVRILFNLMTNALHQIREKGRGKIYVSAQNQDDHNVIFFKDTAGGVLESDLAHLFEGYMSTKENGTGVGLAFCKATMEIFGGQMHAQIVEQDCIEFVLIFPKI